MKSDAMAPDLRLGYEFGGFVLDPQRRQLRRSDGRPVDITPRVFDMLLYFVERPGELLEREALLQALWPGLVVEDNNLSQTLSALRRALGDEQLDRYVLTVPRRGFRFVCDVRKVPLAGAEPSAASAPPSAATAAPAVTAVRRLRLWPAAALVAGVALALSWLFVARDLDRGMAGDPAAVTLAVLPFKPLLPEQRDEALELGMADSLVVRISPTPGLVVRSVGSVRRFAGSEQDPLAAARQLDVRWIVDGTIQRWGDRIRVTARLLRTTDGTASWSGSFDERFDDVFGVQEQIAGRVAQVLIPHLNGTGVPAARSGTRDADAWQLFLTARYHAQTIRPSGLAKSVELFERAIDRDPGYALAHAALADSLRRLTVAADAAPQPTLARARSAALRALQIDPRSADAHAALGWVQWWHDWDWVAAERSFRRAIALDPNVAEAHLGLGHLMLSQQRGGDEGLQSIRRARELDPLSRIANVLEASYLVSRGRRDEGLSRLHKALEIDPDFWPAQLLLAGVHAAEGRPEQALAAAQAAERLSEGGAQAIARVASQLARGGRSDEARATLQRLQGKARATYVPPTLIAEVHCALGEHDRTLDALELAHAVRDMHLPFLKVTPCLGALRGQPRFDALVQKMALPEGAGGTGKL